MNSLPHLSLSSSQPYSKPDKNENDMTKVYLLNEPKNSAAFILYGDGGNQVSYTFENGNINANVPASCVLSNPYYQMLLEQSELFRLNIVKLDPTRIYKEEEPQKAVLTAVEDVKTVSQAVEYCAEHFGEVVKNSKQAKIVAEKNGYDFVNLKVKE